MSSGNYRIIFIWLKAVPRPAGCAAHATCTVVRGIKLLLLLLQLMLLLVLRLLMRRALQPVVLFWLYVLLLLREW